MHNRIISVLVLTELNLRAFSIFYIDIIYNLLGYTRHLIQVTLLHMKYLLIRLTLVGFLKVNHHGH